MKPLLAWLALVATLLLLCWQVIQPAPTPDGQVRAGVPFRESDPGGAVLVCVSSKAGYRLPPFLASSL